MNSYHEFICQSCKEFPEISLGLPMLDSNNRLFCAHCLDSQKYHGNVEELYKCYEISLMNLKNHIVYCTLHPEFQAYYFCDKSYRLYCKKCNPGNKLNKIPFGQEGPIFKFGLILERGIRSKKYEKSIIKSWKRLYPTAKEIHRCLLEKLFFDSSMPICLEHLKDAYFYDINDYKFICSSCPKVPGMLDYAENKKTLISHCLEIIKTAKTESINSHILKALQTNCFEKDFFYAMRILNSEKNTDLLKSSICLSCGLKFALGLKLPVSLHEQPFHEICYSCFINLKPTKCLIDGMPITNTMNVLSYKFLHQLKSVSCVIHKRNDGSEIFSYYKKIIPYYLCCGEFICESCKTNDQENCEIIMCPSCGKSKNKFFLRQSKRIINQLKFSETFCDTHPDRISRYLDNCNIKTYCRSCKRIPPKLKNFINLNQFDEEINKKLKQIQIQESVLFSEFNQSYIIYPLIVKLRAYRFYESWVNLANCHNHGICLPYEHLFFELENFCFFLENPFTYEIKISCKGQGELSGIILGISNSENISFTISLDNITIANEKNSSNLSQQNSSEVNFYKPILITNNEITLHVKLYSGIYFHSVISSQEYNFSYKSLPICAKFINYNEDAGRKIQPVLGLKIVSFYIAENENP